MEKFIKRSVVFSLILVVYLGTNWLINKAIFMNQSPPINSQTSVLIAGDSHMQKALQPSMFPAAVNISQTAEPYVVTYWKLKHILPQLNIDTLLLSFGPHNLSSFHDAKFSNKKWATEMFRRTYAIENIESLKNLTVDLREFYNVYFVNTCLYPKINHFPYIGRYVAIDKSNFSKTDEVIKRHFYTDSSTVFGVSSTMASSLDSIIELCRSHNIKPIIIVPPLHEDYRSRVPEAMQEHFDKEKKRLSDQGVPVLDFAKLTYEKDHYLDADHLNSKGAKLFTAKVIEELGIKKAK